MSCRRRAAAARRSRTTWKTIRSSSPPARDRPRFPICGCGASLNSAFACGLSKDWLRKTAQASFPSDFLQRHELDPLRTDTFEMQFCNAQLVNITMLLGPATMIEEMDNASISPCSQDMWRQDFIRYLDAIGRKRLLLARLSGDAVLGMPRPSLAISDRGAA